MKRFLATLVAMALVVMTAGELSLEQSVDKGCATLETGSCCDQSSHDADPAPPTDSSCGRCCVTCCVMIIPPVLEITMPSVHSVAWTTFEIGGQIRTDKPPLPPPRMT